MLANEIPHHPDAFRVIEHNQFHPPLSEQVLCSQVVSIFSDNHSRDSVQQRRSCAHYTRTQGACQRQLGPVPSPSRIPDADHFRMRRGIAGLHSRCSHHPLQRPLHPSTSTPPSFYPTLLTLIIPTSL